MRLGRRRVFILAGVVVFLFLSGLLARWLALENVERDAIVALLVAQAHGDSAAMLAQLHACDPRCRATVIVDARRLKRPGAVLILADASRSAYALSSTVAETRVAWKATGAGLPVVQCVKVARNGNALSGFTIRLLAVSLPIPGTADC